MAVSGACFTNVGVECFMSAKQYCVDFVFTLDLGFK